SRRLHALLRRGLLAWNIGLNRPLRCSCSLAPWEETRLPHKHDWIANPYCARSANRAPDADVIVMALHGGTENPQITPEIGLLVRGHDAAQRRPQVEDLHALTHGESPPAPVTLPQHHGHHPTCG